MWEIVAQNGCGTLYIWHHVHPADPQFLQPWKSRGESKGMRNWTWVSHPAGRHSVTETSEKLDVKWSFVTMIDLRRQSSGSPHSASVLTSSRSTFLSRLRFGLDTMQFVNAKHCINMPLAKPTLNPQHCLSRNKCASYPATLLHTLQLA